MYENIAQLLTWVQRAQVAWDQYNIQRRLPHDQDRLVQGPPWGMGNSEHSAHQARRNPQTISAAWNDLETALLELSYASERLRSELLAGACAPAPRVAYDTRVGAYSVRFETPSTRRADGAPDVAAPTLAARGR